MTQALEKFLGNSTSDHAIQQVTVETSTPSGDLLAVRLMIWNLLNLGHGKSDKYKFSNNPLGYNEPIAEYLQRKKKQLKILLGKTKSNNAILLQEVDIFLGKLPDFVSEFLTRLHRDHWDFVHSKPLDNLHAPLLILYDKSKLELISQRALFPDRDGKNCALEATFKDITTGQEICIVNMHLDPGTDHSAEIFNYQQDQITAGKFTVIGGDANHKDRYFNMAGDRLLATNIARSDTDSLIGPDLLQHNDGFMASPPRPDATVKIIEGTCGYFEWVGPNKIKTFLRNNNTTASAPMGRFVHRTISEKERLGNAEHISKPGSPFVIPEATHMVIISPMKN